VSRIYSHMLYLSCPYYVQCDNTLIPNGVIATVKDSHFDFHTQPRKLADCIPHIDGGGKPGIDHCFVVEGNNPGICGPTAGHSHQIGAHVGMQVALPDDVLAPLTSHRYGEGEKTGEAVVVQHVATLTDPGESRRKLVVYTTQPGVQVYTANFLPDPREITDFEGEDSREKKIHCQHNAICLETQHFPDSVNQQGNFPSGSIIKPEDTYYQQTVLLFGVV